MANHRRKVQGATTAPADIIVGGLEAVEVRLSAGQEVLAEPGALVALLGQAEFRASLQGGVWKSIMRRITGERFWRQRIRATGPARVILSSGYPGSIVHIRMDGGTSYICDRGRWLASAGAISLVPQLEHRMVTGMFAGMGFLRQRLTGQGDAYLHAVGAVIDYVLPEGVTAMVQARAIVAVESTVQFESVIQGGITGLFGGEGWFLTRLTGPGRVILQTLDPKQMSKRSFNQQTTGKTVEQTPAT